MNMATRRAITISALVIIGATLLGMEAHRHLIAALWPYLESFWDTNVAF